MFEQDFRTLLKTIVDCPVDWAVRSPGEALPGVELTLVSASPDLYQRGTTNLRPVRVQVDVYSETYAEAKALAYQIENALHGYRGGQFLLIRLELARDTDETGKTDDKSIYRCMLDFSISYSVE